MALIDMLTDIKSFNYEKVGQKHDEYFGEDMATGFTPNRERPNPSEFAGVTPTTFNQTGTMYGMSGVSFPGPLNWFDRDGVHQTGYTLGRTTDKLPSEFIGISEDGFTQTGTKYTMGDYNFAGQYESGLSFIPDIHSTGFVSHVTIGDPSIPGGMSDVNTHYILGSGNDFNYPLVHDPRPVVDRFDNTHGIGFTAGRVNAKLPSEFIGISEDGFTQTGTKYEMGDYNFAGQHSSGLSFIDDTHATGFTTHRTQKDLGPGLGAPGFHTVEDGGTAGEYIVGSSLYDELGFTDYFDTNKIFTSGNFVSNMELKVSDINDDFHTGLINTEYSRIIGAIPEGDALYGGATNKPKASDFGINHPYGVDGVEGKYHSELRLSDYKGQWKKFGGNAKGLRGANNLGFDEPFIIKEIGDRYDTIGFGMVDGLTDIPFMAVRSIEDVIRITKWTLTPKGIVWNLKQALLQSQNPRKETRIFNPLGALAAVPPLLHTPRHTGGTFIDFKDPPSYPDKTEISGVFGLGKTGDDLGPVGTGSVMENAGADKPAIETTTGGFLGIGGTPEPGYKTEQDAKNYNLGIGKIKVGTGGGGDKLYSVGVSNELQVPYGGLMANDETKNLPKDFIKFRIRDVVNGKWLIFPAHLGTITDTVTPTWTPEKYIGRPDSVHLYGGADRSVSFDFKVAAFTKQEIPLIQEKMNYLMGLGYPTFKKILSTDDETRPVAPYITLTIGDLFNNTPGYFSSIAITMEENATWELDNGFQIPQFFSVGVEFVHVGKYLPQTLGKHYEVPWLTDNGASTEWRGTYMSDDINRPGEWETEYMEGVAAVTPVGEGDSYNTMLEKIDSKAKATFGN